MNEPKGKKNKASFIYYFMFGDLIGRAQASHAEGWEIKYQPNHTYKIDNCAN